MIAIKKLIVLPFVALICASCGNNNGQKGYSNNNLTPGTPKLGEDVLVIDETKDYYVSNDITLWFECSGMYWCAKYFTLDSENSNLRVYDSMYFYKGDYFYMISNDMRDWYADLKSDTDPTIAEKELAEGQDYSINILKDGIYKITFDLSSLKFGVEYKSEIDTPKYYTIKNCEVAQTIDGHVQYTRMAENPNNSKELYLSNYQVSSGKTLSFLNVVHTSRYRITMEQAQIGVVANYANSKHQGVRMLVDGPINVYLNVETYVIRLEVVQ